jgi:reverse gyrase
MNMAAVRRYRMLFQSLSSDNGHWSTPELVPKRHFKLDNLVFKRFVRYRMKPNIEFKDHRAASLARDLGSFDNAREIYHKELSRIKMQEFKGDFALLNLAEDHGKDLETVNLTDVRMKCKKYTVATFINEKSYFLRFERARHPSSIVMDSENLFPSILARRFGD